MNRSKILLALVLAAVVGGCGPVSFIGKGKDAVKWDQAPGGQAPQQQQPATDSGVAGSTQGS
jgi:hypothetical protein